MGLSADDADGEPAVVVPESVLVGGVDEQAATRRAAHVVTTAVLAMLMGMLLAAGSCPEPRSAQAVTDSERKKSEG
jgi:hypothetical protein